MLRYLRISRVVLAVVSPIALGVPAGALLASAPRAVADCTFDTCNPNPGSGTWCKAADYAEYCAGEQGQCRSEECPG
jgi:hypothetical protein